MGATSFDFTGSVVLVTGGGTGIGKGIAHAFLDADATVVITGRRREKLEESLADYPSDRAVPLVADVSDGAQVRELIGTIVERFGTIDVVISNAAGYAHGPITELSDDDWAAMRASNVDGFFHLAKSAYPVLANSKGTFVAVSSVSGDRGDWAQAGYNATKAAVSNFVRSLALDWGSEGIRVNAVAPSFTITDITASLADDEAALAPFVDRIALGRPAYPADIAPAVLFLASDAARYITGAVIPIDGGTSASTGQPHV